MRDHASLAAPTSATPTPGRAFRRSLLGYDRGIVEDAIAQRDMRIEDLEHQAVDLREELLEAQHVTSEAKHDLTRARAELRYWNDRASYVDSEVARARQRATELEESARKRAEAVEADAQERSLQLIDRVCGEANSMLQAAREEAREMFLRFETDVDMSHQKLQKLEEVRTNVAKAMQEALLQFEEAVRELDSVAPVKRIVETLAAPERRAVPTFGQEKALLAAQRFEDEAAYGASEAMSTPLSMVLGATVTDVEPPLDEVLEEETPATPATDTPEGMLDPSLIGSDDDGEDTDLSDEDSAEARPARRSFDPDADFVSMLMRP